MSLVADDRRLRDELEKVQSEVLRLKKALATPGELHTAQQARIEALRRSRAQQEEELRDVRSERALLNQQLETLAADNERMQRELNRVLLSESQLVDFAIYRLNPGPRQGAGCLTLAMLAMTTLLGWLA